MPARHRLHAHRHHRPLLVLVTPALADANNGNWQTASRWARLLAPAYRVRLTAQWPAEAAADGARPGDEQLMIALHARRSAPSVLAWKQARPAAPLLLVLTGTDLYRDIHCDAQAQQALQLADALVTLNTLGAQSLPPALRARCHVVLQSCAARAALPDKPAGRLRALMVGHLRPEKDPQTYWRAVQALADRRDLFFDHIGRALQPALGQAARALADQQPRFRWLGDLPHAQVRRRIQAAHLLVHPSQMEGGAHVVIEALRSGTPVLASRIRGNLGLLGDDWPACFDPGDDAALAAWLRRLRDDPAMLRDLRQRAAALAPRFAPESERAALLALLQPWLPAALPEGWAQAPGQTDVQTDARTNVQAEGQAQQGQGHEPAGVAA